MKRIFPMYKGNSLDKAGFGYSSIQSAKHYMDERPVQKDFDATLPERYPASGLRQRKQRVQEVA